jgi:proline dehydrogenase
MPVKMRPQIAHNIQLDICRLTDKIISMKKSRSHLRLLIPLFLLVGSLYFILRNGEGWLRHLLIYLSQANWARQLVNNWSISWRVASRFVAGADRAAAINVTRAMNQNGLLVTLDYLGESCKSDREADQAREEILLLLEEIDSEGLQANVSVKPTQLGLKIDENMALSNICILVEKAKQVGNFIRIDMEDSTAVDPTLRIYRRLRYDAELDNVGVVIQSYLYRSEEDVLQLIGDGARVRLCKGAYSEPPEIAFPRKTDTDANYLNLARILLSEKARQNGVYPAMATQDPTIIDEIKTYAGAKNISRDAFEFQMLYGIRRDLQDALVREGYQVRIYVPYGTAWYPYFVRRLAERPANLWFFISNFFRS